MKTIKLLSFVCLFFLLSFFSPISAMHGYSRNNTTGIISAYTKNDRFKVMVNSESGELFVFDNETEDCVAESDDSDLMGTKNFWVYQGFLDDSLFIILDKKIILIDNDRETFHFIQLFKFDINTSNLTCLFKNFSIPGIHNITDASVYSNAMLLLKIDSGESLFSIYFSDPSAARCLSVEWRHVVDCTAY